MADITVPGPTGASSDNIDVAKRSLSFTGAGAGWAAQHSLGGASDDDLLFDPPIRGVRSSVAGNLHVEYADGQEDTIPQTAGEKWLGQIRRVFADSTVEGITAVW